MLLDLPKYAYPYPVRAVAATIMQPIRSGYVGRDEWAGWMPSRSSVAGPFHAAPPSSPAGLRALRPEHTRVTSELTSESGCFLMAVREERESALSRRGFLGGLGIGLAGLAGGAGAARAQEGDGVVIERIEAFPIRIRMVGRFKFFEGPEGTPTGRASCVVKITASDGAVGWGESVPIPKWSHETLETVVSTIETHLAPVLIGLDPFDIHGAHKVMDKNIAPQFSTGQPICKAGIDIALHDLVAKRLHVPIHALLGRDRGGPLVQSWTLNPVALSDAEGLIQQGWERGYRNFNIKVGPDPTIDVELARIVKEAVPDGFLWADANCGYELAAALEAAPKLADAGVDVLEAPLHPNRIAGYQDLKAQGALPILMDEGVVNAAELIEFIRLGMLDGVAMKPARCGGLWPARRQMEILEDAGLMILGSGLTDPDISLAATLAIFGAFHIAYPCALNGPQFLGESVVKERLMPNAYGTMDVPEGPGLGVEVDEDKLREMVETSNHVAEG